VSGGRIDEDVSWEQTMAVLTSGPRSVGTTRKRLATRSIRLERPVRADRYGRAARYPKCDLRPVRPQRNCCGSIPPAAMALAMSTPTRLKRGEALCARIVVRCCAISRSQSVKLRVRAGAQVVARPHGATARSVQRPARLGDATGRRRNQAGARKRQAAGAALCGQLRLSVP
jgi:hypothetical protein